MHLGTTFRLMFMISCMIGWTIFPILYGMILAGGLNILTIVRCTDIKGTGAKEEIGSDGSWENKASDWSIWKFRWCEDYVGTKLYTYLEALRLAPFTPHSWKEEDRLEYTLKAQWCVYCVVFLEFPIADSWFPNDPQMFCPMQVARRFPNQGCYFRSQRLMYTWNEAPRSLCPLSPPLTRIPRTRSPNHGYSIIRWICGILLVPSWIVDDFARAIIAR